MGSGAFGLVWPITKIYVPMFNIKARSDTKPRGGTRPKYEEES